MHFPVETLWDQYSMVNFLIKIDSLHLIASDGSALQLNSMDLVSDYSR